jgi:hypothetical protein
MARFDLLAEQPLNNPLSTYVGTPSIAGLGQEYQKIEDQNQSLYDSLNKRKVLDQDIKANDAQFARINQHLQNAENEPDLFEKQRHIKNAAREYRDYLTTGLGSAHLQSVKEKQDIDKQIESSKAPESHKQNEVIFNNLRYENGAIPNNYGGHYTFGDVAKTTSNPKSIMDVLSKQPFTLDGKGNFFVTDVKGKPFMVADIHDTSKGLNYNRVKNAAEHLYNSDPEIQAYSEQSAKDDVVNHLIKNNGLSRESAVEALHRGQVDDLYNHYLQQNKNNQINESTNILHGYLKDKTGNSKFLPKDIIQGFGNGEEKEKPLTKYPLLPLPSKNADTPASKIDFEELSKKTKGVSNAKEILGDKNYQEAAKQAAIKRDIPFLVSLGFSQPEIQKLFNENPENKHSLDRLTEFKTNLIRSHGYGNNKHAAYDNVYSAVKTTPSLSNLVSNINDNEVPIDIKKDGYGNPILHDFDHTPEFVTVDKKSATPEQLKRATDLVKTLVQSKQKNLSIINRSYRPAQHDLRESIQKDFLDSDAIFDTQVTNDKGEVVSVRTLINEDKNYKGWGKSGLKKALESKSNLESLTNEQRNVLKDQLKFRGFSAPDHNGHTAVWSIGTKPYLVNLNEKTKTELEPLREINEALHSGVEGAGPKGNGIDINSDPGYRFYVVPDYNYDGKHLKHNGNQVHVVYPDGTHHPLKDYEEMKFNNAESLNLTQLKKKISSSGRAEETPQEQDNEYDNSIEQ